MSEEEKEKVEFSLSEKSLKIIQKVHEAVDARMRELEETGLSREELLYDGKVVWNFQNFFSKVSLSIAREVFPWA